MVAKIKKKQYEPNEKEKFMNHKQLNYFKNKLEVWKNELLKESNSTLENWCCLIIPLVSLPAAPASDL